MSISQRRHIRFTLDIPVFRYINMSERIGTIMYQISIGGCLIEWDEGIENGDDFRMEVQLPNKNWLPLNCKAVHMSVDDSIGVQFLEITQFEQELIVEIMSKNLEEKGIPMKVDPFSIPKTFVSKETNLSEIKYEIKKNLNNVDEEMIAKFDK